MNGFWAVFFTPLWYTNEHTTQVNSFLSFTLKQDNSVLVGWYNFGLE